MEIAVHEDTKTRLTIDILDGNNALASALKKELWKNKNVKAAGSNQEHPLIKKERLVVETQGQEPRQALKEALASLQQDLKKAAASLK